MLPLSLSDLPKPTRALKSVAKVLVFTDPEKNGIVHAGVAKMSFNEDKIAQNITAFIDAIKKAKPSGVKGVYMKKVTVSSTMGPGLKLDHDKI